MRARSSSSAAATLRNIIDDKYHDVGDLVDRTRFDLAGELVSLSRGVAATAFTLLEPIG